MWILVMALSAPDLGPLAAPDVGTGLRGLTAAAVVLGLVALFAWLLRRGLFGPLGRRGPSGIQVETAVSLGERRSLAVVAVEGRRLLVGLAPGHVSLVAELQSASHAFSGTLERAVDEEGRGAA